MAIGNTRVIQVTNIAPQATKDQMQTLFGYLGKIEDIRLYPTIRDVSCPVQSRICYIKFMDSTTVGISQHMTNTVFIDRALIVIPVQNGEIPDEYYALEMTRNGTIVPGLHVNEPKLPPHVINSVQGVGSDQLIITTDPQLEANDLPSYPPLPGNYDTAKVEETRRTITVQNIDPSTNPKDVIEYFSKAGEVKYLRTATKTSDNSQVYLIEFTDQPSIINALKLNGTQLDGKTIDVQHATQAIVKPQAKSNEAAQKEIEEAMSRFKEAQNMISASIEPVIGMLTKDKRGSRRSRSRSRDRRRRSRSRSRRRSSSRSRGRRRRSRTRSRDRKRSSRSRKRSRSKSRKSRSKSPSWRRKSRDRSKGRRSRDRSKGRRRSKDRKEREKSKGRDRAKSKERERSRDREREREKSKDREKSKEREKSRGRESKSRESKEKKSDKESSVDTTIEKKRSRSRSKYRSRSRDRDRKKKRRSRSRGSRRRTPSPKHRRRSRTRSRDRKKDKHDRKDRKERDKPRDRSRSRSKVPRNYDEEEKGFERAEKADSESRHDKESSEKSDNMDISNSP